MYMQTRLFYVISYVGLAYCFRRKPCDLSGIHVAMIHDNTRNAETRCLTFNYHNNDGPCPGDKHARWNFAHVNERSSKADGLLV